MGNFNTNWMTGIKTIHNKCTLNSSYEKKRFFFRNDILLIYLLVTNTLSASNSGLALFKPRISTHDANPSFNLL